MTLEFVTNDLSQAAWSQSLSSPPTFLQTNPVVVLAAQDL